MSGSHVFDAECSIKIKVEDSKENVTGAQSETVYDRSAYGTTSDDEDDEVFLQLCKQLIMFRSSMC